MKGLNMQDFLQIYRIFLQKCGISSILVLLSKSIQLSIAHLKHTGFRPKNTEFFSKNAITAEKRCCGSEVPSPASYVGRPPRPDVLVEPVFVEEPAE